MFLRLKFALALLTLLLGMFFPAPLAFANGGDAKIQDYQGDIGIPGKGLEARFTVHIDTKLFLFMTLRNKYKIFRINIRNNGNNPFSLSPDADTIKITAKHCAHDKEGVPSWPSSRHYQGILDLRTHDRALWDSLDKQTRTILAYPTEVPPGEERNVYVMIPDSTSNEVPGCLSYTIPNLTKNPVIFGDMSGVSGQ